MKTMKSETRCVCPRCGYLLTPVYRRKDQTRKPIAYCCPEPYCDYTDEAAVASVALRLHVDALDGRRTA